MTNQLVRLIQERIGPLASEFNAMDLTPKPLCELKGKKGEDTPLYRRLKGKQGIYFILQNQNLDSIVYVGRTSDGKTEHALADRLWGHLESKSSVRQRLRTKNIILDDCLVVTLEVTDRVKRIRLEHFFIGVFGREANVG